MNTIVPLKSEHSLAVAALHMRYLPTPFGGRTGQRLLASYYTAVSVGKGAVGYVAVRQDRVLGYVCGVWSPIQVRATLVKSQWSALAFWLPASILAQPQLLVSFIRRLDNSNEGAVDGYELRPIVVDPTERGTGLAIGLVERLILDASGRGFETMHLVVEAENLAAQMLYRKAGFQEMGMTRRGGYSYLCYERSLIGT